MTAFLGSFLTWRFCGMGRGGAGPFFLFHCPSVVALSGDSGVSTGGGAPVGLRSDMVMVILLINHKNGLKLEVVESIFIPPSLVHGDLIGRKIVHYNNQLILFLLSGA